MMSDGRASGRCSLLDDPALLAPLLGALTAADLSNATRVCRSWRAAERADRNALFHTLVRKQWPGLVPPLTGHHVEVDWRHRYCVLSRWGSCRKPPAAELDPLQPYTFTIQGHWGPDGELAFSQRAVVHKVHMSTVFGGHAMDFKDVVSFEVRAVRCQCHGSHPKPFSSPLVVRQPLHPLSSRQMTLLSPVALPESWRTRPRADEYDGLELSLLAQYRSGAVDRAAHVFSFSVHKAAICGPGPVQVCDWWGHPALQAPFTAEVDTQVHPTAIGCGPLRVVGGKPEREEAGWLGKFVQGMPETALITSQARMEPSQLALRVASVDGRPHLAGLSLAMELRTGTPTGPVGMPLPVLAFVDLLSGDDTLDWC